jgi:transposase
MQVLANAQWAKPEAVIAAVKLRGARPRKEDHRTDRHRNLIERCRARLQGRRVIATCYDKTAMSCTAGVAIAATLGWFKSEH